MRLSRFHRVSSQPQQRVNMKQRTSTVPQLELTVPSVSSAILAQLFRPSSAPVRHQSSSSASSSSGSRDVVIIAATRTPIGCFQSALASLTAPQLAAQTIQHALSTVPALQSSHINELYLGHVLSAGTGQAPQTQAALLAGLPATVPTTAINKVCSSGMKSVMVGAASIREGVNEVVVCGGMESMSQVPYYAPKARRGYGYGHGVLEDGLLKDGLWDAIDNHHMGDAAELTAKKYSITRQQQDDYAIQSYERAQAATKAGHFAHELTPVTVKGKKGDTVVSQDEEPNNLRKDKVASLRPVFQPQGTITAANSSPLSDGASCIILSSLAFAQAHGITPLARVLSYADAQQAPVDFPTSPAIAIPLALRRANRRPEDVSYYEINEAFASVALANQQLLRLDGSRLNVWGGAVALGHPLGSSGSRIVVTLLNVLRVMGGRLGVAGICNGGGGGSAIVVERWEGK